jgi:pectinesterase inhibitor-like protein
MLLFLTSLRRIPKKKKKRMVQFEEDNPDDLLGNMVVLGISLIVIAAVVIGVVAGIDRPGDSSSDKMTQTESLDYVCGQTDYKQSCMASLQPAGKSAAVISYFRVAVNATLTAMAHAMKMVKAGADAVSLDHESEKMALEDCIELIGLCMEELQSVITIFINSTTSTSFHYDSGDIRSSLSAVLSYQRACLEGVLNKNFRNRARFSLSSPNP